MKRLVMIFVLLGVVARAEADVGGIYGGGMTVEYGNAYLPPTAEAGMTTMLSYREHGGVLGKFLLVLGSAPAEPGPTSSTTEAKYCYSDDSCTIYTTTTYTPPTQEAVEKWEHDLATWEATTGRAIMAGELGQELEIDIPLRALGGNASGFMLKMFRSIPGTHGILSVGQFAFGWMTFHDVKTRVLAGTPTELMTTERVADHTFKYVGIPCRFRIPIGDHGFGALVQFDLNWLSIVMPQPSPVRLGLQWVRSHAMLSVEGVVSGFRPDGASLSAEASLAF